MTNTTFAQNDRLILRKARMEDVNDMFELLKDPQVNTFLPWFPLTTLDETKVFLKEHFLDMYEQDYGFHSVICLRDSEKVVGYVHIDGGESHDFGYAIAKEYWHQGIASEASYLAFTFLKQLGIPYITATHDVQNPNSGKVMEKLGMEYCYTYEESWQPKNITVHFRMYQLNFDGEERVYQEYQLKYPNWIENLKESK